MEFKVDITNAKLRLAEACKDPNSQNSFTKQIEQATIELCLKELYPLMVDGISVERLEAICEAERSGTAITVPFKIGDTLYAPCADIILETKVTGILVYADRILITSENYNEHGIRNTHAWGLLDLGKIYFLTRENAISIIKEEPTV
jgi:hypothetical protein